jgi:elongation factor Ts
MSTIAITATLVNELRNLTGAGLMDCKKALTESNGDVQAAIDVLRKKGAKVAEKRAGRESLEGCIVALTAADGKRGVVSYLSCETDFVAKNDEFRALSEAIAKAALAADAKTLDEVLALPLDGTTVKTKVEEKVSAIGELISISSFERLEGENIVAYNHAGNKIGVLVSLMSTRWLAAT